MKTHFLFLFVLLSGLPLGLEANQAPLAPTALAGDLYVVRDVFLLTIGAAFMGFGVYLLLTGSAVSTTTSLAVAVGSIFQAFKILALGASIFLLGTLILGGVIMSLLNKKRAGSSKLRGRRRSPSRTRGRSMQSRYRRG